MPKVASKKRKRVVLTLKQKMDICTKVEKGVNRQDIMDEYGIGSSTIYDIRKQSAQILYPKAALTTPTVPTHRTC